LDRIDERTQAARRPAILAVATVDRADNTPDNRSQLGLGHRAFDIDVAENVRPLAADPQLDHTLVAHLELLFDKLGELLRGVQAKDALPPGEQRGDERGRLSSAGTFFSMNALMAS